MIIYKDIDNNSGIYSYEINSESITVWFKSGGKAYTYSYKSAGRHHVENMKKLAATGNGLNSYIMKNVRSDFEK